jgi:hypothetical protein
MPAYSFLDVQASIVGPGIVASLGAGSGTAEEGISYEFAEDKDTMTIGADGTGMHSLHGGNAGTVTVRFLKNSPTNALLQLAYDFQRLSSANWGQNVITITNPQPLDTIVCAGVAFRRNAPNSYSKDGANIEWQFNAIRINPTLGPGGLQ